MRLKHKSISSFIPIVGILALIVFWAFESTKPFDLVSYFILGLVLLIVGFSLYFKVTRYKSERSGLTAEDEFSRKIKVKAAANAFNLSIYMWVFVVLFLMDLNPRNTVIVGLGIILMGLIFFLNWFYLSKVGIPDENKD